MWLCVISGCCCWWSPSVAALWSRYECILSQVDTHPNVSYKIMFLLNKLIMKEKKNIYTTFQYSIYIYKYICIYIIISWHIYIYIYVYWSCPQVRATLYRVYEEDCTVATPPVTWWWGKRHPWRLCTLTLIYSNQNSLQRLHIRIMLVYHYIYTHKVFRCSNLTVITSW